MISVKRCAATNLSATPHHHHHQQQHHHHNGHHVPVQVRSLSAGRTAGKSNGTTVSGSTGSNNNNRLIRSRNSPYLGGGYSSGGSPGGGPAIIANGGSLYYSNSSVLGPTKSRSGLSEAGSDIYDELDSLFLVPKCALTYDKAMSLRKDLAAYDFNIRILEDTPRGNVWISGNRDASVQKQTRPSSANKAPLSNAHADELQREREERIKQTKERQNEERQRKLEELKAQALAAQKFREQKEEERRRRMEDLRRRENDRRSQVEERRRAIQEAENERRQYILQKNQERDQRMDAKRRNERSSIQFAFGSSTPRMIETSDSGMCSSFWAHRRATSITNVAYTGAPLTRRSSERELTDGSSKKRATSASGLDRSTDDMRRMSSSMYEVFNWASSGAECPKKLTLSLAGAGINIDEPPSRAERAAAAVAARKDDSADMSYQRTVNRRKTDLMPTIPSPRDSSRSSLGTHTPRTPGRAFSMTRLDQLAQPRRRNGEHISAILERERRQALELENMTRLSLSSSRSSPTADGKRMSRSMSQLATAGHHHSGKFRFHDSSSSSVGGRGARKSSFNAPSSHSDSPMGRADTSKSMSQLNTAGRHHASTRLSRTERLRQQVREQLNGSHQTSTLVSTTATGLRSGEITPNSLNTSRPGSAMSSSTTASGVVYRRSLPASAGSQRKPRPISIAVTGVSGLAKEEKPPLPKSSTGNTSSTSLERKRSQSGTSTPAKPAAPDTPARKHSSAERPHRVGGGSNSASARGTPKASSTPLQSPGPEKANRTLHDSLVKTGKKQASQEQLATPLPKEGSSVSAKSTDEKPAEVVEQKQEEQLTETVTTVESVVQEQQIIVTESKTEAEVVAEPEPVKEQPQLVEPDQVANSHEEKKDDMKDSTVAPPMPAAVTNLLDAQDGSNGDLMTASMIAKRITTEEEAKAALAERRRLAREEAERQAELERQRIAAEEEAEAQRQYEEEERLRKLEEESIRLAEEARRLEEERLQQAIEEATKREEEEKLRREEEARQKIEREESERKAREEAERQRIEMAERLKKEEKEREERRKRVEAIMSRTRAKGGSATNTPTKQSDEKDNAMSKSHIVMSSTPAVTADTTMSMTESMLGSVDQPQQQQSQEQDQAPSSGAESLEQAVQSLSLENNNNTNSNATSNGNHNNNNGDYERSVTEKENLLLGAFNNNGHDNNGSSAGSQQPSSLESSSTTPGATTNGKSTPGATTIAETTELIIEDAIMSGQTNGHKNGSIDNVFTQNPPTVDAKFLTHFDDTDELAPVLPPSDATDSLTNPLDAANDDLVVPPPTSQLIDFSSFQSLTAEQSEQPPQQPADDQDPFNLNINSINNNNNTNINNSSSVNPFDDDSSSLVVTGSTTSFSTNTTSLFTGSDANLISNSNFLNNNSTRLVATSDSQDNRDLSLL
ncbi:zinc finger CCCH domain-containing protein 13 isoform X2 [Culex quinquefasciatus]|uniref:zinc finger CCCH domain-containing protein 13 isoform X2 n=1 Tax=Culex quinquefasciatus TaxID=7176 RepID=UPI0018E39DC0|nr:zinc finger CCCH domain-containing protein 13 isoform X2 [Culex quinquefasciatus]